MTDVNWRDAVQKAEAYKAVGQTEICLRGDNLGDYPWKFATACQPGGSHRMEIDTSVWFYGEHPCGLTFRWSFDIEPRSANGQGHYEIDVAGAKMVMGLLPLGIKHDFQRYLAICADKVHAHAGELWIYAQAEFRAAETLRAMADAKPEGERVD